MSLFKIQPASDAPLDRFVAQIRAFPDKIAPTVYEQLFQVYSGLVIDQFREERGWKPLSERTQIERDDLGYPPATPINVREGFLLRSLTDENMGAQTGWVKRTTWGAVDSFPTGNRLDEYAVSEGVRLYRFGTLDVRFEELDQMRRLVPDDADFAREARELTFDLERFL